MNERMNVWMDEWMDKNIVYFVLQPMSGIKKRTLI